MGRGVLRIDPVSRDYCILMGRKPRVFSHERLRRLLSRRIDERNYILQHCIELARHEGYLFDLRVPVQRGEQGLWTMPGMVAKLAVSHPFLTNLAQGGRAIPGELALQGAFSADEVPRIIERIQQLTIGVAEAVAARYLHAADLGLDIGVDRSGHPWLFEVNTRDQRITFARAGLDDAFRTLYRNPLIYCALLNSQLEMAREGAGRRRDERRGKGVASR